MTSDDYKAQMQRLDALDRRPLFRRSHTGSVPHDPLDIFDALPQNQPEPMTEADERAALDALLGISPPDALPLDDEMRYVLNHIMESAKKYADSLKTKRDRSNLFEQATIYRDIQTIKRLIGTTD